jgi:hypothetical protein
LAGGAGGITVCGAGGAGFAAAALSSSNRSPLRRESTDIDAQEVERQCGDASMWNLWPPTENEIELPACADGLNASNAARK